MGDADDADLDDGRVVGEDVFDLGGVDVEARHDDQVLGAVDEVQPTVVVDRRQVAGVQPAVGVEHPCRRLRLAVVALEHVGAVDPDLTRVADEHVVTVVADQPHLDAGTEWPTEP